MRALLLTFSMSLAACIGSLETTGPGTDPGSDSGSDIGPPPGTGSDTGDGGGSATARTYFNGNVYGAVANSCGAVGCHNSTSPGTNAPGFVNPTMPSQDDSAAWTTITGMVSVTGAFTPTVPLLNIPQNTAHFAKFSTTQVTTITSWLALEAAWRNQSTGGTPKDYMADWSGCIQYDDFVTANMATAWAKGVNTNEGKCQNCHVNGQANSYFIASPDPDRMFAAMTTYREYLSTYFTVDTATNAVVINSIPFELAAEGGINGEHPVQWDPANNKGMDALNTLYTLTKAHMDGTTAPACGPSTLAN